MVSFDESYLFDDDSDDDGSDSGSAGMCSFPFRFDESVGRVGEYVGHVEEYIGPVSDVGSGVFVLTGIEIFGDVVLLVVFVPKGVKSKGGRLIEICWRPKS